MSQLTPQQISAMTDEELEALASSPVPQAPKAPTIETMSDEQLMALSEADDETARQMIGGGPVTSIKPEGPSIMETIGGFAKGAVGLLAPGLKKEYADKLGKDAIEQGFGGVEARTGAPAREALSHLQKKDGTILGAASAFGEQFGKDPESAATGKQIASKMGFSEKPAFSLPLVGEVSPAGAAGLGLDIVVDPIGIVTGGSAKATQFAGKSISRAVPLKKGVEKTFAAAKRLGIKPTKSQIYDSQLVDKLEGALKQTPFTVGGARTRASQANQIRLIDKETEAIAGLASGVDRADIGSEAISQIKKVVHAKLEKASELYNTFEESLGGAPADISPILEKLDDLSVKFKGNRIASNKLDVWKSGLVQDGKPVVETIDELKNFRSSLSDLQKSIDPVDRRIAQDLWNAATDARSKSLVGAGADADLIRAADEIYKDVAQDVVTLTKKSRAKGSPRIQFEDFIEKNGAEGIVSKLFKLNDHQTLKRLEQRFPEAFVTMRAGKVDSILKAARGPGGKISPKKFSKVIDNMTAKDAKILFGDNAQDRIRDIRQILENTSGPLNPSGTAVTQIILSLANPYRQLQTATVSAILKAATSGRTLERVGSEASRFALPAAAVQSIGKTADPVFQLPGGQAQ